MQLGMEKGMWRGDRYRGERERHLAKINVK